MVVPNSSCLLKELEDDHWPLDLAHQCHDGTSCAMCCTMLCHRKIQNWKKNSIVDHMVCGVTPHKGSCVMLLFVM